VCVCVFFFGNENEMKSGKGCVCLISWEGPFVSKRKCKVGFEIEWRG
jgi:hypothetical protein